ncbi:MAG: sporulation protein YabP [Firmicutes bacterium]|nr:sporulation protein YabP [Bacillota bacterium]
MEERQLAIRKRHQITLQNRERLLIDGVTHVESFDDMEIILQTDAGTLIIRGEGLHIKELNIDSSNLAVIGHVSAMEYTSEAGDRKGKSFFGRLFK